MEAHAAMREAYVPNRRVMVASDVASTCALALLLGVLGSAVTWWGESDLFDLARRPGDAVKMNLGYLVGPVAILVSLPLVFGRRNQVALKHLFRLRLATAATLWVAGLAVLEAKVSGLDGYDLEAGAYGAAALLALGLTATVLMWPNHLAVVQVDANGHVRVPVIPAAAPRARSQRGP